MTAGAIVLERNDSARRWVRADRVPGGQHAGSCGNQVDRVLRNRDYLAGLSDLDGLLSASLKLAPGYQAETVLTLGDDGWEQLGFELKTASGMAFSGRIGGIELQLIPLLRDRTLGEAIKGLVEKGGELTVAEGRELLEGVHGLVENGVLECAVEASGPVD